MGAGASVPDELDLAAAKELAGDQFDEERFNALASEGKISKQQFEEAAAAAATAQLSTSESAPAVIAGEESKPRHARQLFIAVDGTDLAHQSFECAMRCKNDGDRVTVLHVCNAKKEGLPPEMEGSAIRKRYKQCLKDHKVPLTFSLVDVLDLAETEQASTKEAVCHYVNSLVRDLFSNELESVLMFCGYSGRKGLHGTAGKKAEMMGSTTDMSMREAQCSNVIIKPGSAIPPVGEPAKYLVYVDGNAAADHAATDAFRMMNEGDEVCFMHVHQGEADSKPESLLASWWPSVIKGRFEAMIQKEGVNGSVVLVQMQKKHVYSLAVPLELQKTAGEMKADFIVLAADLVGSYHYSEGLKVEPNTDTSKSISDRVVRQSDQTVVVTYASQTVAEQILEESRGDKEIVAMKRKASFDQGLLNEEGYQQLEEKITEQPKQEDE